MPSYLQSVFKGQGRGITSVTASFLPASVISNGTLAVCIGILTSGVTISKVKDTQGNIYTLQASGTTSAVRSEIWIAQITNPLSPGDSIIITPSSLSTFSFCVDQYLGSNALGNNNFATGNSQSPSVAVSVSAGSFAVASFVIQGTDTDTVNEVTGNLRDRESNVGSGSAITICNDNTTSSAGSVTNALSYPLTNANWAAAVVELQGTAGTLLHSVDAYVPFGAFAATAKYPAAIAQASDLLNQLNYLSGETLPTLASSIGATDTSLTIAGGAGDNLPNVNFAITIEGEIIFVTSRNGNLCSGLLRGAENTTATSHSAGVTVNAFITAKGHNQNSAEINAIETALGTNLSNIKNNSLFTKNVYTFSGRVLGTVYQNTTGQPLILVASIGNAASNLTTAVCDSNPAPTTVVAEFLNGAGFNSPIIFVVPVNFYYKISGSGATISSWVEFTINTGSVTASGELSGSRVLSTIYQNTTGKALLVVVDISGVSVNAAIQGVSDSASSPTTVTFNYTSSVASAHVTAFLIVPNNHYYKFTASTGSLAHWNEYTMPFGATRSADLVTGTPQQRGYVGSMSLVNISPNYLNLSPTVKDLFVAGIAQTASTGTHVSKASPTGHGQNNNAGQMLCSQAANDPSSLLFLVQPYDFYSLGFDSTSTFTFTHWWEYVLQ